MEKTFSKDEVLKIAKEQKVLCWLFLGLIIIQLLIMLVKGNYIIYSMMGFVPLILIVWAIITVYRLSKSLKKKYCLLYAMGVFIPFVSWVILIVLIHNATKILRASNIAVGIMGAKKQSLDNYQNQPAI
ncbi:MAG: hypothetical protein K9L58_04270 [Candidatus Omnitrophica bacterium]|jgi:membrane-associated HD superfamily phosphohydrolase|nr:hypothetical protein [Candidatus Omnitrophota bacterium]MCF7892196.1 hypothetical protein [Candidatus Omnitrophota bacterium]MCF7895471.1 hypothetical protein [Candidatus Omnitrophota bacterium]MCF7909711.1 hypothetical protein [Candidatus Omnitrophota bacterium]